MDDKPTHIPTTQPDGAHLKSIVDVVLERRATRHFVPEDIKEEHLNAILRLAAQAPSGYNLQPWRFIIVRDPDAKMRLQEAAYNQPKVSEASVVIIAVGTKEGWKNTMDEIFQEGAKRGAADRNSVRKAEEGATQFLSHIPMNVWVNRHTMIAVTTMMLVAESYGFNTAPMEGFDPEKVKKEFNIPADGEVVALLAIGRAKEPEQPYPGRLPLEEVVFAERYGKHWPTGK